MSTILSVNPHPVLGELSLDAEFGAALAYLRPGGLCDVTVTWSHPDVPPPEAPPPVAYGRPPAGQLLVWTARLSFGDNRTVVAHSRPLRNHDGGARRALRAALGLIGVFPDQPQKLGRPGLPAVDVVEMARRYRAGETLRQLEASFPYSFGGIRGNLLRAGVRMRPRGRKARRSS